MNAASVAFTGSTSTLLFCLSIRKASPADLSCIYPVFRLILGGDAIQDVQVASVGHSVSILERPAARYLDVRLWVIA